MIINGIISFVKEAFTREGAKLKTETVEKQEYY